MRLLRFLSLVTALFGLSAALSLPVFAASTPQIDPLDLKNITLVKDVKPGMVGYGRTVFHGTKVETFKVKVLGVLKKANYGTDLILVKMDGGPITARQAYLIQGMSGSPIYINGKIAGAFAYGEAFAKEPIGMVTPIENMLDAWDPSLPSKPSSFTSMSADLPKPIALSSGKYGKIIIDNEDRPKSSYDPNTLVFRPLSTPLLVSGLSPRAMARLSENLKPLNLVPMAGGGRTVGKGNSHPEVGPGSSIGISLVAGDVEVSGVGTLTYRRGNRILAFGHPMISGGMMSGIGALDALLSTAYVYDVFPGMMISHKIAAPGTPIGRMRQDRPWAIGCELGSLPEMIPVSIKVSQTGSNRSRTFNCKVVNHPLLSADFISTAVAEAVFEMCGSPSDTMAKVSFEVVADEVGSVKRRNVYFDPMSIDMAVVEDLDQVLSVLNRNPFYPVQAKKVSVNVELSSGHQTARIEKAFVKEAKYEPGETVEVGVVLRPFKGERVTKVIPLRLPCNMPDGDVAVLVSGGAFRSVSGGGPGTVVVTNMPSGAQTAPSAENLKQMMKRYLETDRNDDLVARIVLPRQVPSIGGERLSGLPPTIAAAMRSAKSPVFPTEPEEIKTVSPSAWIVSGLQRVTISVKRKTVGEGTSSSSGQSQSGSAPSSEGDASKSGGSAQETPDAGGSSDDGDDADFASTSAVTAPALIAGPAIGNAAPLETAPTAAPASDAKPETVAATTAVEKPVGKTPTDWRLTSKTEFARGTLTNVAVTSGDLLTLAPSVNPLCASPEIYIWSLTPDGKGGVYAGSGNHGIVYQVGADGKLDTLFSSPELEIHALARDAQGNVYAGTSPNGVVYRIAPDGKGVPVLDADEKYITAVAVDSKGNLYAGTGDGCAVYMVTPDGHTTVRLRTPEYHVLALAVDKDDNLYVGTGGHGIVYRVKPDGSVDAPFDAAEEYITALACASDGSLFVGTSTKGVVYRVGPDGVAKTIYDKAGQGIVALYTDGAGGVYGATSQSLFHVLADESVYTLENKHDAQFLSMAISGDRIYAGSGNIGSIYTAEVSRVNEGVYESPVHDCGSVRTWGGVKWNADLPAGTSASIQTRTGETSEPDELWNPWSAAYTASGARVASPVARFIQFRVTLRTTDPKTAPKLRDIDVSFMARNNAPKVTLDTPKSDDQWSKKQTIKWVGSDPDKDKLIYQIYCSDDDGKSWRPIGEKTAAASQPAGGAKAPTTKVALAGEELYTTECETVDGASLGDIYSRASDESAIACATPNPSAKPASKPSTGATQANPSAQPKAAPAKPADGKPTNMTTEQILAWDTSEVKDGVYRVKVVASDRLCNPIDPLSYEVVSDPFVVTNIPPKGTVLGKSVRLQADRTVQVSGVASHGFVPIAGVQYKIGDWEWTAAAAGDGVFDSREETFTFTTQPLSAGNHTIQVKVIDVAGNSATMSIPLKIGG